MNFEKSFELIQVIIEEKSYKKIFKVLYSWLDFHIMAYFCEDNEKAKKLTLEISNIIKVIIDKTLENFGAFPRLCRFTLNNYYEIGDNFSTSQLREKIQEHFHIYKKKEVNDFLCNELKKKNPQIKKISKGQYVILPNEKKL